MKKLILIPLFIFISLISCENNIQEEEDCQNEYCFYVTEVVPSGSLFGKTVYRFKVRDLCTDRMYYLNTRSFDVNEFWVGNVYCGEY